MTKEALTIALEALEGFYEYGYDRRECFEHITAIKKALAQPEQEPVAWMSEHRFDELRKGFTVMTTLTKQRAFEDDVALYTTPPQRTWVGLTDDDCFEALKAIDSEAKRLPLGFSMFAANIQAKLKEKNTLLALPVVTLPLEIK